MQAFSNQHSALSLLGESCTVLDRSQEMKNFRDLMLAGLIKKIEADRLNAEM
jgi:hypothetical protein